MGLFFPKSMADREDGICFFSFEKGLLRWNTLSAVSSHKLWKEADEMQSQLSPSLPASRIEPLFSSLCACRV